MLCIVQDDPSDKVVQLLNMANIYGDAYFTIVAANGTHAQGGIPGMSRQFPPTSLPPLLRFDTSSLTASFVSKLGTEEGRVGARDGYDLTRFCVIKVQHRRRIPGDLGETHGETMAAVRQVPR